MFVSSQSLSTSSFTSSLRKRAGTASASGPLKGLKRSKKTGAEHLANAVKQLTDSNEEQASQLMKEREVERSIKTSTERALTAFLLDFEDLDVDDRVLMTEVFENEVKSRTYLVLNDPIMRRRWVENQLDKIKKEE